MARAVAAESKAALEALAGAEGQGAMLWEDGAAGQFRFDASDLSAETSADPSQAVYIAPASDATGASGAWVRKDWRSLDIRWFGAAIDNVTDDSDAVLAAVALSKALAVNASPNGYYKAGPPVYVPPVGITYMGTTTLDITHTLVIEGESNEHNGTSYGSALRWAAGATGIRIQAYNTSGASTVDGVTHFAGSGTIIRNLLLQGGYSATEGEYHGIHAKQRFSMSNVIVSGFQGDGLHIDATSMTGDQVANPEGNANLFRVDNCSFVGNRDGIFTKGADANAGSINSFDTSYNRRWGVSENSFLGNTYSGGHADGNGMILALPSVVSYGGNRFAVKDGQETGASTNAPPATQTDNTWWYFWSAGGPNEPIGIPAWSSGMTVRAGGPYRTTNANGQNVFTGCYSEGSSGPAQLVHPTVVIGGLHGAGIEGTAAYIRSSGGGGVQVASVGTGDATTSWALGTSLAFGHSTFPLSAGFIVNNRNNLAFAYANSFETANTVIEFTGPSTLSTGIGVPAYSVLTYRNYSYGYNAIAGTGYTVGGVQVVGAQGAAVADATDAASVITQLNALLARLRTHGLIAT
jgi:hypothetical protein